MSPDYREAERRFAELVDASERLRAQLPFAETRELARLYRLHSARLAALRSTARDPEAIHYLNALCVRAYSHLYVAPPRRRIRGQFFLRDLPTSLGATWEFQRAAAVLLMAGALIGASVISARPDALPALVPSTMYPPDHLERLATSPEERARFLTREPVSFGLKSMFSAGLFVHNTRVGLLSFASGILAGVPTILLALYNGLILGAFAWIFSRDSGWPIFWAWLLPHAVPELLAIVLCSAGGLALGRAVLAPGRAGRAAALRGAARTALQLVLAALPLFVAAALIESFVRQSLLSTAARFAVAALAVIVIAGYVLAVRHLARRPRPPDLDWLTDARVPGRDTLVA